MIAYFSQMLRSENSEGYQPPDLLCMLPTTHAVPRIIIVPAHDLGIVANNNIIITRVVKLRGRVLN